MRESFERRARELGFLQMKIAGVEPLGRWRQIEASRPHPQSASLRADPRIEMPDAQCVIMLAFPYAPFRAEHDCVQVDAYYVASNSAHQRVRELADFIQTAGFLAQPSPSLPYKALARRAGMGNYGRNGLIQSETFGSRFVIQAILTNAPLDPDPACPEEGLAAACLHCGACVAACPSGALDGSGNVDMKTCVRAQPEGLPLAEKYRRLVGVSLLGCDICQRACPQNQRIADCRMPPALREALRLERLLAGERETLSACLGSNNARKKRLQARAAVIAANLARRDLIEQISPLCDSDYEPLRRQARWALEQLHHTEE